MNIKNNRKIVVGLSGGIDSAVALHMLKKQDWQPIGLSLKYARWQPDNKQKAENICSTSEAFSLAKKLCSKLNVPYHIQDVSKEFEKQVIQYFKQELKQGRTPNPCVMCNPNLKFKKLFEYADKLGVKYVATGHYARIVEREKKQVGKSKNYPNCHLDRTPTSRRGEWRDPYLKDARISPPSPRGRNDSLSREGDNDHCRFQKEVCLFKSKDPIKDQTYSLSFLPQKFLSRIVFPLGDYTKDQVYEYAKKNDLQAFVKRPQSQDFCFIAPGFINKFLKKELGEIKGEIRDLASNKKIGEHNGLWFYTIGQRKGLDLPGGPYYVVDMDRKENILYVSKHEKDLYTKKEIILSPYNFISEIPLKELKVKIKIRSHSDLQDARLKVKSKKEIVVKFDEVPRAVTPGQFAVFYVGNQCLGGGRIC